MNNAERKRRTREALLEAAAQEFEAHGYAKTTLQGVADRLGLTRGTVLFHFHTKDALRDALIVWCDERLCASVTKCGNQSEYVRMFTRIADLYHEDVRIRAGLLLHDEKNREKETARLKWDEALETSLRDLSDEHHNNYSDIQTKAIAAMFTSVMSSSQWQNRKQLHQALDFLFSLIDLNDAGKPPSSPS